VCLAKKTVKKLKTQAKEKERKRRMEIFCRLTKDKDRLNAAS